MSNQDKPWPIVVHVEKLKAFVDGYPRRMKSQPGGNFQTDSIKVQNGTKLVEDWKRRVKCRL